MKPSIHRKYLVVALCLLVIILMALFFLIWDQ